MGGEAMSDKATFEIHGTLTRAKEAPSGKCVFITVETRENVRGREKVTKHDLIAFGKGAADAPVGERVIATGRLDRSQVRGAKRTSDNGAEYDVWAPSLICVFIRPETVNAVQTRANAAPAPSQRHEPGEPLDGDDDLAF